MTGVVAIGGLWTRDSPCLEKMWRGCGAPMVDFHSTERAPPVRHTPSAAAWGRTHNPTYPKARPGPSTKHQATSPLKQTAKRPLIILPSTPDTPPSGTWPSSRQAAEWRRYRISSPGREKAWKHSRAELKGVYEDTSHFATICIRINQAEPARTGTLPDAQASQGINCGTG